MGNPHRGEVEVSAGDQTYTLRYTVNAWARIENAFDLPRSKVIGRVFNDDVRTSDVIRFFWGGLWQHHRQITEEQAGEIMEEIGEEDAVKAMLKALGLSLPEPVEGKETRPRKARG